MSVLDAWTAVAQANIAAQQRLDPTFPRQGNLHQNVDQIAALADAGKVHPSLIEAAEELWRSMLIEHQTDLGGDLSDEQVAECEQWAADLVDALNAVT